MELSLYLAKAWGLLFLITSISLLANRSKFEKIFDDFKDLGLVYITGFVSLVIGILMVLSHNIWMSDYVGLVTLIGWLAFIKGIFRLLWPDKVANWMHKFKDGTWYYVSTLVILVISLYLLYNGFQI